MENNRKCKICEDDLSLDKFKNGAGYICKVCAKRREHLNLKSKNAAKYLYNKAKWRCGKSGREFNIDIEDIVIPEYCPILGIKLDNTMASLVESTPSLDRIDNNKGYIKGNVKVISWAANRMKGKMSMETLIEYAKLIIKNTPAL